MAATTQQTLDKLPREGVGRTTIEHLERKLCEECGEPAHFKRAYLLEGYRHNIHSSAYHRDDTIWCCDLAVFLCRDCSPSTPPGYDPGYSLFPANEKNAELFLYWHTDAVNEQDEG